MQIAGLQKVSLIDFEGYISAIIFTRSCPFRCPFCHNPELVIPEQFIPLLSSEEIMDFLKSRTNQLEGVCITGGEPTLQKDLLEFIKEIKDLGYKVKLDTNGFNPLIVDKIVKEKLVDYLAMDYKSPLTKYSQTTNSPIDPEQITKSVQIIMNGEIPYEFRTTVVKPIHCVEDFKQIGQEIRGAQKFYIQNFVKSKHVNYKENFKPFSDEELAESLKIIKKYVQEADIR